ncbi:VOC family protein [Nocardioides marinquilinus]|uniref:VOC family protein n=1 Tax=Nocardioides marinquilinus TaxID=1210400 RepID=A0ABP9PSY3_9ACTN
MSGSAGREVQVTFDAADPRALSVFWCAVLGYELDPPPDGFDDWDAALEAFGVPPERRNDASACHDPAGRGPRLFFQRVPEGAAARNRVHLDVRAAPGQQAEERMATLEAECDRLVALGGVRVERHEPAPPLGLGHVVMTDPEGNVFCLD